MANSGNIRAFNWSNFRNDVCQSVHRLNKKSIIFLQIFQSEIFHLDAMGKSISRLGSTMCGIGVININENKYIFHKQIGEGAFSYVDLIEDLKDGTNFALKRIICHDKKVFDSPSLQKSVSLDIRKKQFLMTYKLCLKGPGFKK